jgi:alpha-ribazole phosphatase
MEIYLIRHTETIIDKGTCYGQSDVTLKEPYHAAFDTILSLLNGTPARIYSSPLQRCKTLAEYIFTHYNPIGTIQYDSRLKEINFGEWELQDWNTIHQPTLANWMADYVHAKPPQGESFTELYSRVLCFIQDELPVRNKKSSPIILVTHAGVIRSFLCYHFSRALKDAFSFPVEYGSVTKVVL